MRQQAFKVTDIWRKMKQGDENVWLRENAGVEKWRKAGVEVFYWKFGEMSGVE